MKKKNKVRYNIQLLYMEKLPFNKVALLENLQISKKSNDIMNIKLINKNVKILISIMGEIIYLYGFYKQDGIEEKGIVRCALYVLLKNLLEKDIIQKHQIMKVSSPTPDDGNIERLIKIYTQIGFIKGGAELGNPINLYNSVEELIETLKEQCEITGGRKRRKTLHKKKRKSNKTRRKYNRKKKKKKTKKM